MSYVRQYNSAQLLNIIKLQSLKFNAQHMFSFHPNL